jgi:hypothetical protein
MLAVEFLAGVFFVFLNYRFPPGGVASALLKATAVVVLAVASTTASPSIGTRNGSSRSTGGGRPIEGGARGAAGRADRDSRRAACGTGAGSSSPPTLGRGAGHRFQCPDANGC